MDAEALCTGQRRENPAAIYFTSKKDKRDTKIQEKIYRLHILETVEVELPRNVAPKWFSQSCAQFLLSQAAIMPFRGEKKGESWVNLIPIFIIYTHGDSL